MFEAMSGARPKPMLSTAETEALSCYVQLEKLIKDHGDQLPPFAQRNAIKALGSLWQVANGLDGSPGHPYDLGV